MISTTLTHSDREFLLKRVPLWRRIPKSRKSRNVVNKFLNNIVAEYWDLQGKDRVVSARSKEKIDFRIRSFFHNKRIRQDISNSQETQEQSLQSSDTARPALQDLNERDPVFGPDPSNVLPATKRHNTQLLHELPSIATIEMDMSYNGIPASPSHSQADSRWSDLEIDELDE